MNLSKSFSVSFNDPEFENRIAQVVNDSVSQALEAHFNLKKQESIELLTRDQVADFFKISLVTLRDWEVNCIIPPAIRIGSRVYWRAADIYDIINRKGGKNVK